MSDSKHPVLSRLTSLKPLAGLPPREPAKAEGITQAPAPREVQEQLEKGDEEAVPLVGKLPPRKDIITHIDDLLTEDARAKGIMPVIEQDETEGRRRRTGFLQQLANQEPSRVHSEEAVGRVSNQQSAPPAMIRLSINPTLRKCQVESAEDMQATVVRIGAEVTVKLSW
jgi:hypothetical protein